MHGGDYSIISIVGARPNFIKLAALAPLLDKEFTHIVVHTGQHYDFEMSRIFFHQLDLREPDAYLGVGSGTHGYQVGEMIKRIEEVLMSRKPDIVIVYGDTNTTLAGALATVKAGFRIAHVEAGLRVYNLSMQEEINRRVVDHVSHILFAPTKTAMENLERENVIGAKYLTGDVHVDVLMRWLPKALHSSIVENLGLDKGNYVVVTVHRAENVDQRGRLRSIVQGLLELSKHTRVVFPVHPRTRKRLIEYGLYDLLRMASGIMVIEPLGYLDFIRLLHDAELVVTDSGGVQREAYLLGKYSIVLRDETEWVELVKYGYVILLRKPENLPVTYMKLREKLMPIKERDLLGDGRASERIADILREHLKHA
mgnify:CR=1 FL=1